MHQVLPPFRANFRLVYSCCCCRFLFFSFILLMMMMLLSHVELLFLPSEVSAPSDRPDFFPREI